jgi:hypothetical protein
MRKKMINLSASLLGVATVASTLFSCSTQQQESPMKAKVEEYAHVELKSDLVNNLNDKEKELVKIFFQVGEITDDLFWQQTFGDKSQLDTITDSYAKEFAMIHYGLGIVLTITNRFWPAMARNRLYVTTIRMTLQQRSSTHSKTLTRIHGTPLSAETKMVH